jgi:hypothetical protein
MLQYTVVVATETVNVKAVLAAVTSGTLKGIFDPPPPPLFGNTITVGALSLNVTVIAAVPASER